MRLAVALLALAAVASSWRAAGAQDAQAVVALRGFFVSVAAKDYAPAWSAFSAKTQAWVAQSIAESASMPVAEVRSLLDANDDRVQRGFWDSFRESSKPDVFTGMAMTPAAAPGADAAVKVNGANVKDMTILMYKEAGRWKVGWMETFFPGGKLPKK
jgi:hypothetical protein